MGKVKRMTLKEKKDWFARAYGLEEPGAEEILEADGRAMDVLQLMVKNNSRREIAEKLGISTQRVREMLVLVATRFLRSFWGKNVWTENDWKHRTQIVKLFAKHYGDGR